MGWALAIDGRRLKILHTTTNQKIGGRAGGDYEGEARQAGGAGEAGYHHFWEALQLNEG